MVELRQPYSYIPFYIFLKLQAFYRYIIYIDIYNTPTEFMFMPTRVYVCVA